jgi:hypothetical protein
LIRICLDQFYSLSNLILILKFHKIILAPLLGALSTRHVHTQANNHIICSGSEQHTDRKNYNDGHMNESNTQAATIEIPIKGI